VPDGSSQESATGRSSERRTPATKTTALERLGRALAASPLEVGVGLATAIMGILIGEVEGQVLTGLGGVLISYSATLKVAEERARENEARRVQDLREREVAQLRGFYRQIYNTHIQILEATTEPEERSTSFALITQSNRNLFFLLTEIEAIIGELDIRVASLTNRMRANMQEMEVLLSQASDEESAERLAELEAEQERLKSQLEVASGAGSVAAQPSWSGQRATLIKAWASLVAPGPDASPATWASFVRAAADGVMATPEFAVQAKQRGFPLTAFGDALRVKNDGPLPTFEGFRGLASFLAHALVDTPYCIVRGRVDPLFRGLAFRDHLPQGSVIVDPSESGPAAATDRGWIQSHWPTLLELEQPRESWSLADWVKYLQTVVETVLVGRRLVTLQTMGDALKKLSAVPLPRVSGVPKLRSFLQLALTETSLCVVEWRTDEYAVVRREEAEPYGGALPDMKLVDGIPRYADVGPADHTVQEYRKVVRECVPPLYLPQPALRKVVDLVTAQPPDDVPIDDLAEDLAAELPPDLSASIKPALRLLERVGVLRVNADDGVSLATTDGHDPLLVVQAEVTRHVEERLGSCDEAVVAQLVGAGENVDPLILGPPAAEA
jgi:hypothetical protein